MEYRAVKALLIDRGLTEIAAINWASYLTRDGLIPTPEAVEKFAQETLKQAQSREQRRRARQPQFLTTPEERFGGSKGPNETD